MASCTVSAMMFPSPRVQDREAEEGAAGGSPGVAPHEAAGAGGGARPAARAQRDDRAAAGRVR